VKCVAAQVASVGQVECLVQLKHLKESIWNSFSKKLKYSKL